MSNDKKKDRDKLIRLKKKQPNIKLTKLCKIEITDIFRRLVTNNKKIKEVDWLISSQLKIKLTKTHLFKKKNKHK